MSPSHSHSRHSQSNAQSFRANTNSTTPMASPRLPHSVGQPYPPAAAKMSPIVASDVRTPSPNYFGLAVEPSLERDSAPRDIWSPPTSSVKSFAAALPQQLPLDANPEFEAFKRQADANRSKGFSLGSAHFAMQPPASTLRPRPPRIPTNQSDNASETFVSRPAPGRIHVSRMDIDSDSLHDSAYVSSDSKRNSEVSLNTPSFFDMPKHESPAQTESPFHPIRRSNLSKVEDAHPRLSLPQHKMDHPVPGISTARSETMPPTMEGSAGLIMPAELQDILKNKSEDDFLLLDVRVSTLYAQSRIRGALNLCIPTTLLKRATFDLKKLQKTLQTEEDQGRFSRWQGIKYLIIYDGCSAEKRDALSVMNMFKKFSNEGYSGSSYLLRGGFDAFAASCPSLVDYRSGAERAGKAANSSDGGRPTFAPVIGGVTLPTGGNNPNPFFSNIRQNMDLADGVGQLDIAVPPSIDARSLPRWLQTASEEADHGKGVSEKFLEIERSEQARMRDAYSAFASATPKKSGSKRVTLSGIEKGGKNRYKDILPFEHTRVRLANKPEGTCDYINASYIRASRSNKRYIACQGPLPATFDVSRNFTSCLICHIVLTLSTGFLVCCLGPRCPCNRNAHGRVRRWCPEVSRLLDWQRVRAHQAKVAVGEEGIVGS
jgi:tyrosine-protein phosphatase 2/3